MLYSDGIVVGTTTVLDEPGTTVYAVVEPAGSRWLPWPGRTSRWWYEVHGVDAAGGGTTYAYTYAHGTGSGGAYTLRGCVRKALAAVDEVATA